ncbi:Protein YIPF6 [Pelomyxa schiedti]|nr:Protein YIPF6 [Pelomyxa schiedti]
MATQMNFEPAPEPPTSAAYTTTTTSTSASMGSAADPSPTYAYAAGSGPYDGQQPPPLTFEKQEPFPSSSSAAGGMMMPDAPPVATVQERTLDEPVWLTIWRDVKKICVKLFHVIMPHGNAKNAVRDWDLWGPLVICMLLAVFLSLTAPPDQVALVFALVFVFVWVGAFIITINALLLGGNISIFQSICVLGYCVFPLCAGAIVLYIISIFDVDYFWLRFVVIGPCFAWSTWASVGFMGDVVPKGRKALSVYPIFLFYFVIAWMIVVQ